MVKELILFSLVPALVTIPVTAFICRVRIARNHRLAYGTMLSGVFIVMFCWVVIGSGGAFFSPAYWHSIISTMNHTDWTRSGDQRILFIKSCVFGAAVSLLPAFGVVHYYQKRSRKNETPAA